MWRLIRINMIDLGKWIMLAISLVVVQHSNTSGLAFLSSHVMKVPFWPNGTLAARHLAMGQVLGRDHYIFFYHHGEAIADHSTNLRQTLGSSPLCLRHPSTSSICNTVLLSRTITLRNPMTSIGHSGISLTFVLYVHPQLHLPEVLLSDHSHREMTWIYPAG